MACDKHGLATQDRAVKPDWGKFTYLVCSLLSVALWLGDFLRPTMFESENKLYNLHLKH